MSEFYSFSAASLAGDPVDFSAYRGKVVLVVNTASRCGFTPQYAALEALHRKYKASGLAVLGFPCNQFLRQEPGDAASIQSQCLVHYGVSFPVFAKIDVNGPGAHPLLRGSSRGFPVNLAPRSSGTSPSSLSIEMVCPISATRQQSSRSPLRATL